MVHVNNANYQNEKTINHTDRQINAIMVMERRLKLHCPKFYFIKTGQIKTDQFKYGPNRGLISKRVLVLSIESLSKSVSVSRNDKTY